jgi:hypothetical protein
MMNKVFGIGWAKTGTTTLGKCFRILGYNHQSQRMDLVRDVMQGNFERVRLVVSQQDSFEDWPWIILFRELDTMFPNSKFVLTTRDPEKWLRSYRNMLSREQLQGQVAEEMTEIRRFLYSLPFPHVTEEQLVGRFIAHNNEVKEYFANHPEALLVVNWERGDGWTELCEFLGKSVPSEPFPHENRGKFQSGRLRKVKRLLRKFRF